MEEPITIDVICSNGHMFEAEPRVSVKVADFKEYMAEMLSVPANEQRFIYRGMTLEDDRTLDSYGIEEYHTIHMDLAKNRPTGDMPDMSLLYAAIFQMTKTLLSRPQLRDQIISQNRQLRSMFDSNPELSDIIQHHELVRSLTSPQMMQAPESQLKLSRQNSIRHYIPSAAGPSTSFNAMAPESQHSTLAEDVAAGPSTSAMGLLLQRSSDMKYQIGGWVILAASIVAWRILKS